MQYRQLSLVLSVALAFTACSSTSNNGASSGGGSSSGDGSSSGGTYTPPTYTYTSSTAAADHSTPTCNADTQPGLLTEKTPCTPTAVADACTNDWDCWQGQTCVSGACASNTGADDKNMTDLTLAADGDYMVSVFIPADKPDDVTAGLVTLAFPDLAARDEGGLKTRVLTPAISPANRALLASRVAAEPALRKVEAKAIARGVKLSVARDATTCTATQFGFKGTCYEIDGDPIALKCGVCGGTEITTKVLAIQGDTAILADTDDSLSASDADVAAILKNFATIAGPRDRIFFNQNKSHATNLDIDGNGLFAVVFSSKVGSSGKKSAGLFDPSDALPASDPAASGNAMDLVWVQPPGINFFPGGAATAVTSTPALAIATLAHEYQHLINFVRRSQIGASASETLFLNEALSHLAEDITGFGSSNIGSVSLYLSNPEAVGFLQSGAGTDQDSSELRGFGYLYMRYLIEGWGGFTWDEKGAIVDHGVLPFLDRFYTNSSKGLVSLAQTGGSLFDTFPIFMPRLAISNNATVAPLVKDDTRFNFQAPKTDPLTNQLVGINLADATRADAHGTSNVLDGYKPLKCPNGADALAGHCEIYATGGVTFLLEGAHTGDHIKATAQSVQNVRVVAVKVK